MAKYFGVRISRIIPSFHSCRSSKDHSTTRNGPDSRLSPSIPSPPPPTPPRHIRHVPVVSSRCGCRSFHRSPNPNNNSPSTGAYTEHEDVSPSKVIPAYLWRKDEKWHVVVNPKPKSSPHRCKIDSDDGGDLFPPLSIPKPSYRKSKREAQSRSIATTKKHRNKNKISKKKSSRSRARASTSSADSCWFSSDDVMREYEEDYAFDDDDEAETLINSSNSFSTEGEHQIPPPRHRQAEESLFPRKLRWIPSSCMDGKVKESFAVVKRSEDPYEDFLGSMMEMVLEKQIYEAAELEQLLQCFLSLNSADHHGTIFSAFSEIWEALFPSSS